MSWHSEISIDGERRSESNDVSMTEGTIRFFFFFLVILTKVKPRKRERQGRRL